MVAGNSLANLHSPVDLIMNPYTGIGLALMAGGLEWSDGFAGLAPKPSKGIVALTKKKKEIQKEKEANARTAMMKSFGNSPLAAKLYYQNAEEIVKIYKARKRKNPDGDIRITLKDLGLDYKDKDFQDKYGSAPEQKLINDISHWANYFDTTGLSVRKTSKESQSEFIEQSLDTYGPGHNYLTE